MYNRTNMRHLSPQYLTRDNELAIAQKSNNCKFSLRGFDLPQLQRELQPVLEIHQVFTANCLYTSLCNNISHVKMKTRRKQLKPHSHVLLKTGLK